MAGLKRICASAGNSRILIALLLIMGALTLTACGGDGSGSSTTSLSDGGTSAAGSDDATTDDVDDTITSTGVKIGNGTGADFAEGVIGADDTSLLAGGSTTLRINFVDSDNDAFGSEVVVEFTSACYATGIADFSVGDDDTASITTSTAGFGTITYTANGCSGDDEIIATATVDDEVLTASVTFSIEADEVLALTYIEADTTTLNLAGTGGTEATTLSFQLVGAQGASIVGESVSFAIQGDEGDATLAEDTDTDVSNAEGTVSTVLQSGTVATNIKVVATHDNTGITAVSDSISISAGLPFQQSFSLSQSVHNPAGANGTDGIPVTVTIRAGDQFGNYVSDGTQVSFWAECGVVAPNCTLVDSVCEVEWVSNNANQTAGGQRCSLLAFTEGVETFDDFNGNFVYDGADGFNDEDYFSIDGSDDLPEPWLDANDNGIYDIGEDFVDTSHGVTGEYDYGNTEWDGLCLSGIYPEAVCTGDDSSTVFTQGLIAATCELVAIRDASPAVNSTIDISSGGSSSVTVTIGDGCTIENAPAAGSSVEFSGDGIEIIVGESQEVPTNITDPVSFGVTFRGDGTAGTGELKLEVETPGGGSTVAFWTVID